MKSIPTVHRSLNFDLRVHYRTFFRFYLKGSLIYKFKPQKSHKILQIYEPRRGLKFQSLIIKKLTKLLQF